MNAPLDVRGVIRATIDELRADGNTGMVDGLLEVDAAVAELIEGYRQIKHSIQQARIPGNDWRRELALIGNTTDAALANIESAK